MNKKQARPKPPPLNPKLTHLVITFYLPSDGIEVMHAYGPYTEAIAIREVANMRNIHKREGEKNSYFRAKMQRVLRDPKTGEPA